MFETPKYSIIAIAIATLLIGMWGIFPLAPAIVKFSYSILIYCAVCVFPYKTIKDNDFGYLANCLFVLLLVDSILQILMTVYNTDADMYEHGNKWITLLFNEVAIISLLPPLFAFFAAKFENISIVSKSIAMFIIVALLTVPIRRTSIVFLPVFFIVFFPYIKKKCRLAYLIVILLSLYDGLKDTRMLIIANAFSFAAIFLSFVINSKILRIIFASICVFIPFLIFIPILSLAKGELSFFQSILQYLAENHYIDDTNDTRTFLYLEIAQDIEMNNTWLFGKGAYCHYFSEYFSHTEGDDPLRMGTEVPFLNMLLHGGLLYIFLYYGLLLTAIVKALLFGQNKFVQMSAIIVAGWFLNSFIGDLNGFRFFHLGFFFLVGCCLSERIRSFSDKEIQLIFEENLKKVKLIKTLLLLKIAQYKKNIES